MAGKRSANRFGNRRPWASCFTNPRVLLSFLAVCIPSSLYIAYSLPKQSAKPNLHNILSTQDGENSPKPAFEWKPGPKRLVVFGDSWSDNGKHPVNAPGDDQALSKSEDQGRSWTEWFCQEISCVHHDNFARPVMMATSSASSVARGAIVDSSLLNSSWMTPTRSNNSQMIHQEDIDDPLADLRGQVQEWIAFEKTQYGDTRSKDAERIGTIFAVWFSLWDLWYYSSGVFSNAEVAVTKSIDVLFEQLDVIAGEWTHKPQVILLDAIDVTFLPSWQKVRTGALGSDMTGDDQRYAILLAEQWNQALERRARRWNKGSIYIYHASRWFMNQIREGQMVRANMSDANGKGVSPSPWVNVRSGCLGQGGPLSGDFQDNDPHTRCPDPGSYLFWDDFHIGPTAMKMIGREIAAGVTGAVSVNPTMELGSRLM